MELKKRESTTVKPVFKDVNVREVNIVLEPYCNGTHCFDRSGFIRTVVHCKLAKGLKYNA